MGRRGKKLVCPDAWESRRMQTARTRGGGGRLTGWLICRLTDRLGLLVSSKPVPKDMKALVIHCQSVLPSLICLRLSFLLLKCRSAFCR